MEILTTTTRTLVNKTATSLGKNVNISYEFIAGSHPLVVSAAVQLADTAPGSPTMQNLTISLTWERQHNVSFSTGGEVDSVMDIITDVDLELHAILDTF